MIRSDSPYIIGETAYNHEGDIKYLYRMIDDISDLNLDAVKFHMMLDIDEYAHPEHPIKNTIKSFLFSEKEWDDIIRYSKQKGLDVIILCDDTKSISFINKNHPEIAAMEIHAVCINDINLLKEASSFRNTVILGIGGCSEEEIGYAVDFLRKNSKKDIVLIYGFQNYPTDYSEINLSKMLKIKKQFDLPVGYADHTAFDDENNEYVSSMAVAMGINILEKHYTPDHGIQRIDHQAAVGKHRMEKIKKYMELAFKVYGRENAGMSKAELKYGETGPMKKAIVACMDIKKGEELSLDKICFKRTPERSSVSQIDLLKLAGLKVIKDIKKDEIIDFSKLESKSI